MAFLSLAMARKGNAPEILRRTIFLATAVCSKRMGIPWDSCQVEGGDYRHLGRLGLADELQFSALLWPSRADSGILYLHGGQRVDGIPEPHEPGHIRERLKEVRATNARAKKSGPLTPPCPNHPRWRCGVLPKQEARGSRCQRRCRGRARGQGRTGRTQT